MSAVTLTRTRGYVNVPPYETTPGARVAERARFAFASGTTDGRGVVVLREHTYATLAQARRERAKAVARKQRVSPVLTRAGERSWLPVAPRLRAMYAPVAEAVAL